MNELQRTHYLDAMGITQYVPRWQIPGAKASTLIVLPGIGLEKDTASHPSASLAAPVNDVPGEVSRLAQPDQTAVRALLSDEKVALAPVEVEPSRELRPSDLEPESRVASSKTTPSAIQLSCRLSFFLLGGVLVADDSQQLTNDHLRLLRDIAHALNRAPDNLAPISQFIWPPDAGLAHQGRLDVSETAARETLLGLLEGLYQHHQNVEYVVSMGALSSQLLCPSGEPEETGVVAGLPILATVNLQSLLENPTLKKTLWERIKGLQR